MIELAHKLGSTRFGMVGSTYIFGEGADKDMLFLVPSLTVAYQLLKSEGWETESEKYDQDSKFMSMRRGEDNALITSDGTFFCGFLTAATVCKYLHETHKWEPVKQRSVRVALHAMIRDMMDWNEV